MGQHTHSYPFSEVVWPIDCSLEDYLLDLNLSLYLLWPFCQRQGESEKITLKIISSIHGQDLWLISEEWSRKMHFMLFLGWGGCSGESAQKGLKGELKTVRFNHGAAILKLHHGCWRVSSPRGRPWMTGVLPGCQLRKASSWGAAHRATELRRRSISAFLARTCFWLDTETPAWSPTCSKWLVDCPESNPTAFSGDSSPAVDFLRGSLKAIQIRLLPTVRVMAGLLLGMVPTDGGQNYQAWDFSSPSDVLSQGWQRRTLWHTLYSPEPTVENMFFKNAC